MKWTRKIRRSHDDVEYTPGSRVKTASKYAPYGAAPFGLLTAGLMADFADSWIPFLAYLIPFFVYVSVHQLTQDRFLSDAAWAVRMTTVGFAMAMTYPMSIAVFTALFLLFPPYPTLTVAIFLVISGYLYSRYYYRQFSRAWKEKKASNRRFAIDPDTRTFRFDAGFNFGHIDSLRWDDYVFGGLLSISSTGASFLGGIIYQSTEQFTVAAIAGICLPCLFAMLRLETTKALVTARKIREYEKEHDVQIRPR